MIDKLFRIRQDMTFLRFDKFGFDAAAMRIWQQVNNVLFQVRSQLKEDTDD